jgi:hypothetical protein
MLLEGQIDCSTIIMYILLLIACYSIIKENKNFFSDLNPQHAGGNTLKSVHSTHYTHGTVPQKTCGNVGRYDSTTLGECGVHCLDTVHGNTQLLEKMPNIINLFTSDLFRGNISGSDFRQKALRNRRAHKS